MNNLIVKQLHQAGGIRLLHTNRCGRKTQQLDGASLSLNLLDDGTVRGSQRMVRLIHHDHHLIP